MCGHGERMYNFAGSLVGGRKNSRWSRSLYNTKAKSVQVRFRTKAGCIIILAHFQSTKEMTFMYNRIFYTNIDWRLL